jgi:hypothetical protein
MTRLTTETASLYARTALGHVTREYPNKLDHVIVGPGAVKGPRDLHPVFFGSFDWHSCVHAWWTLFTVLRLHPDIEEAQAIRALADDLLTEANVAAESAYLAEPSSRGFERPYGWAWLLMLAGELTRHDSEDGRRWSATLKPLADAFAERFRSFLPLATYPVRVGTHYNTAFALALTLDYAAAVGDAGLADLCRTKARDWHWADAGCQAWEPSQDEFLSPALMEAELMRRVLTPGEFADWFDAFLPDLAQRQPATLFVPASVSDRSASARRSGTLSIAMTRPAPNIQADWIANWPTGPQPHTATVSPSSISAFSAAM